MMRIGLTGGLASGKSAVARMLRTLTGAPFFDADATVHALLDNDAATIRAVSQAFPKAAGQGGISRPALGEIVFSDAAARRQLEAILHPRVYAREQAFWKQAHRQGYRLAISEIPLLFETGAEARYDAALLTSAPLYLRRARALARQGMTEAKFQRILAQQMPEAEKRKRADYIIATGLGRAHTMQEIRQILASWNRKECA